MRTAYKCRAYPDQMQASLLNRTFGCVRVVWNQTLAWRQQRYQTDKTGTTYAQASAYAAFFAQRARYPRFKTRDGRQSAAYTRSGFRWRDGRLFLAKMDAPLAFTWSWPEVDPATINPTTVTVSRDPCGRWYVAFAVEVPEPEQLPATGRAVGVDLHKTSTRLVRDHDLISLEDLAVKNMMQNRRVAKAISDCGWGTFRDMLEYKAARYGRRAVVIDRWFPSSKMCSACGHVLAELSLDTRQTPRVLPGCSRAVKQEPRPVRTGIPSIKVESSQPRKRGRQARRQSACHVRYRVLVVRRVLAPRLGNNASADIAVLLSCWLPGARRDQPRPETAESRPVSAAPR